MAGLRNKLKDLLKSDGFTMIELLIVIALMGIISIPIGASLIFGVNVFEKETETDRVFQDEQLAFVHIKDTLRANPYEVTTEVLEGETQLIVKTTMGETIRYFLKDQSLIYSTGSSETILCDHVTFFQISDLVWDQQLKLEQLTVSMTASVFSRTQTLTSSVSLRRY